MKLVNNVIYLDNEFIVETYQKVFDEDVATKYTKTTDVSLGMNFIASAGASLKETFEYPITTQTMYQKLQKKLNQIKKIELQNEDINNLPDLFWMDGIFGIGEVTHKKKSEVMSKTRQFEAASKEGGAELFLATNDLYFSSGYDQLLSQAGGYAESFAIEAQMLLKYLGTTKHFAIAAPMIVIKTKNFYTVS